MSTTPNRIEKRAKRATADAALGVSAALGAPSQTVESALARAFAAFARGGPALACAGAVDDLLRVVVCEVRKLVGVERCSIGLRDEAAGLFRGCVRQGGDKNIDADVKQSLAGMPADGMTLELLRTKRPVIISNARNDPRVIRSTAIFWSIRSMMAVPIVFGD